MIGLDTNVLVRYLLQDDVAQADQANHLLNQVCSDENPAFISLITVIELVWILRSGYGYSKEDVLLVLEKLLMGEHLKFEAETLLWRAWYNYQQGTADFADYLLAQVHQQAGCETTYTFDKKAARSPVFTLLSD